MTKLRVLHLINNFSLAGAEKLVFDIVTRMDQSKFEIVVCSIGTRNDSIAKSMQADLNKKGIKNFCIGKQAQKDRLKTINNIRKLILKEKIDIIHTHCPSPDFYGKTAAFLAGVKKVYSTVHNSAGYSAWSERFLQKITTKFVTISEEVQDYAVNQLKIAKLKTEIVYNGIDLSLFSNQKVDKVKKLKELGLPEDSLIITNIGRLTEQKGQPYLVKSAKAVVTKFPKAHFLILGDDKADPVFADQLKELAQAEGINDKLSFLGVRQDVAEFLAISDIFVLPSLWEGFAIVALEAMAAGLPMVATDVGVIKEAINDKTNGLIIPAKDSKALGEAINFLLADKGQAEEMGRKAKMAIEAKFSIENTVKAYERLYRGES